MSGAAERFHLPTDAAARDALAGEYVLGTLDAETAARVGAAIDGDVAWRTATEAWEARLAPLAALARPEPPPPDIWDRIEARITAYRPSLPRRPRTSWLWKGWAIAATLAAAGVAAFAFLPVLRANQGLAIELMAPIVFTQARAAPTWVADLNAAGELRLVPFRAITGAPAAPPPGHVLQLWAVPPGATSPVSVGLLPGGPGVVTIPLRLLQPVPDMLLEISVEEPGGSKVARPTGPVLFVGRLTVLAPPS